MLDASRPGLAALASAIVPGAGQLWAGRRKVGWWLIGISLAAAGTAVAVGMARPLLLATWWVRPDALRWLFAVNLAVWCLRSVAAWHAYVVMARRTGSGARPPSLVVAAAAALVIAAPHAVFAYYDIVEHDLITSVFAAPETTLTTVASATSEATTSSAPPLSTTGAPDSNSTSLTEPPPTTTTTTPPPRLWDGVGRLNVMLLGGDAGPGRIGVRTDTIILASIDPATGDTALFSVPRNLRGSPLPPGHFSCDCYPDIINALWDYATRRPDSFTGAGPAGAEALRYSIGALLGLEVHYFALIDLNGFVDLVDAFGGIDITVADRLYDPSYPFEDGTYGAIEFSPGEHHMDGHESLAYARIRYGSSDYDRMGRQRCVLEAAIAEADPLRVLRSFPTIARVIKDSVVTDVPVDRLPDIVDLIPRLDPGDVVAIGLVPGRFGMWRDGDGYTRADLDEVHRVVETATGSPAADARRQLGIEDGVASCGVDSNEAPAD